MRILHVNKYLYRRGGAESYMLDVAAKQSETGAEVAFFGMADTRNPPSPFEPYLPSAVDLEPSEHDLAGKVRIAARMFWSPGVAKSISEVIRRFRPDVAHLHNIYHQLSPSVLRPLKAHDIPMVMTLHDYKLACPTYARLDHGNVCSACIGGKFHRAALKRCKDDSFVSSALLGLETAAHAYLGAYDPVDAFICPSRFMEETMRAAEVYPDRLRHVPHFVETDMPANDGSGNDVLYIGRLSFEKGVDVLVRAAALLPNGVTVKVAGDGPASVQLQSEAAQLAHGKVHFLGRLDKSALRREVGDAAMVVLPSRCYENQPMSILEAKAAGLPVIGTSLGGIPELVRHEVDGLLVPPNDVTALGAAMNRLLRAPGWARALGEAGRLHALKNFSSALHLQRLDDLYREARCDRLRGSTCA